MAPTLRVLLVSGSLRRGSTTTAVLRTAQYVASDAVMCTVFTGMADLPAFDPDLDVDPLPPAVDALRRQIRGADALVFSTPEYAGALPGSFKNLLDWTVGDAMPGSIAHKPVGWVNAAPRGAALAHESLRRVLGYVAAEVVERACVDLPVTSAMVGEDGIVSDPAVQQGLAETLEALSAASARQS